MAVARLHVTPDPSLTACGVQQCNVRCRWQQHTWFWTRSLIRSMGAAAVFETAAETPPTVIRLSATGPSDVTNCGAGSVGSFL